MPSALTGRGLFVKDGIPGGLIIKNRPKSRPNSIELSFVSYSFVKIWNPA